MKFIILDKSNKNIEKWDNYVDENESCSIYHTYNFLKYIAEYFNCKIYLFCVEGDDEIIGILPMHTVKAFPYGYQLVSNPFNGSYGGLCANSKEIGDYMVKNIESYVSNMGVRFAELREERDRQYELPTYDIYVNYQLSLFGSVDEIWTDKIKSKTRNQIRKSLKSDLEWEIYKEDGVKLFYEVYEETMVKIGSPFFKMKFFSGLMRSFPENMFISIVRYRGKPISALWLVKSKNKIYNPWAGLIRKYQKLCPNNLNYWKAVCWAHELGFSEFDFGRSIKGSSHEKFKKGWGADSIDLSYYYILNGSEKIPEINPTNKRVALLSKVWRVMPISVKRIVTGSLISRVR